MKLILHNYRRCPFCIRVRIVLYLLDIKYDIVEEPLREWTDWMREHVASGEIDKARVPVLRIVDDSGEEKILLESNAINVWLNEQFSGDLVPDDIEGVDQMGQWWAWCDETLKPQIDIFKYGRDRQFDAEEHVKDTEDLAAILQKLESHLAGKAFLVDERLTLADIAIIPFIRQIMRTRDGEFDFTPFPQIQKWAAQILGEEWFDEVVMKKL